MEGKSAQRFWKPGARVTQLPDFHYRSAQNLSNLFLTKTSIRNTISFPAFDGNVTKNKNAVFSPSCRFLAAAAANSGGRFFNRPIVSGQGHTGGLFLGQVIVEQVKQCNRTSSGAYLAGQCLLINVSCDHLKAVFYELEFQS